MSMLGLIWRSLSLRKLSSTLTALNVALGVMLVIAILILQKEMEDAFERPGKGFSFVVGAPGDDVQLILNTIYHRGVSPGNIGFSVLRELEANPSAALAVPYSVGDSFKGFRVVGTSDAVFSKRFPQPAGETSQKFSDGGPFTYNDAALRVAIAKNTGEKLAPEVVAKGSKFTNEAVIGATVAVKLGISIGDQIEPTHGVEGGSKAHAQPMLWKVTGILKRTETPIDEVVYINLDSFYRIPDHGTAMVKKPDGSGFEGALSSIVLFPKPGVHKALLGTRLKARNDVQVAEVAEVLRWLFKTVGGVQEVFLLVSILVVIIGTISIMVAIYNTMNERRREIAIMRSVGARRLTVMGAVVGEAALLAFLGALAGIVLAHILVWAAAPTVLEQGGFEPNPWRFVDSEPRILALVTIVGALAGLVPAWKAYRTDVAKNLAPLS